MAQPIVQLAKQPRKMRRPSHTAYVRTVPWCIQPFMIAPVLAGETLKGLTYQMRTVTAPIQNSIVGWWHETFFFYVKLRDLAGRNDFVQMMLDYNKDMSAYNSATDNATYHKGSSAINWQRLCMQTIVEKYFRNDGDAWNVALSTTTLVDGSSTMPLAQVNRPGWIDSVLLASSLPSTTLVDEAGAGTLTTQEADVAMRAYEFLRMQGMADMTYEDFLRTYGVNIPRAEEQFMPELIRYGREWQYPSNTVDPQTGIPSSAVSWAIAGRADKDRFFKEPGFILGLQVIRPKVYFRNLEGSISQIMNNGMTWLPALLSGDPSASLIEVTEAEGPVDAGLSGDYIVDIKDYFLYGDQWVSPANIAGMADFTTGTALVGRVPTVDLPGTSFGSEFASTEDIKLLFPAVDDDPVTYATDYFVRSDIVVDLQILGNQIDTTPTGMVPGL